jgi:hypothetical protein
MSRRMAAMLAAWVTMESMVFMGNLQNVQV